MSHRCCQIHLTFLLSLASSQCILYHYMIIITEIISFGHFFPLFQWCTPHTMSIYIQYFPLWFLNMAQSFLGVIASVYIVPHSASFLLILKFPLQTITLFCDAFFYLNPNWSFSFSTCLCLSQESEGQSIK